MLCQGPPQPLFNLSCTRLLQSLLPPTAIASWCLTCQPPSFPFRRCETCNLILRYCCNDSSHAVLQRCNASLKKNVKPSQAAGSVPAALGVHMWGMGYSRQVAAGMPAPPTATLPTAGHWLACRQDACTPACSRPQLKVPLPAAHPKRSSEGHGPGGSLRDALPHTAGKKASAASGGPDITSGVPAPSESPPHSSTIPGSGLPPCMASSASCLQASQREAGTPLGWWSVRGGCTAAVA